jgi:hypothetical protein
VVALASGGKAAISVNDVSEAAAVCAEVEAAATSSADGVETKKERTGIEARIKKNIVVLLL